MKNLNLIKRLWTDSHEKQSPQRFGRYVVMLIMLLTIGVGQMWGNIKFYYGETTDQVYLHIWNAGSSDNTTWNNKKSMTKVPGTTNVWYYEMHDNDNDFYVIFCKSQNGDGKFNDNNIHITSDCNGKKYTSSGTSGSSYTPPTFTVSYNVNGGSGSTSSHTSVAYNASVTLRNSGFTRSNYTFAGWNTASDGTGTYYAPGASYTVTANRTFYAMWVPTAVLGGTNVMAYCGELDGWNQTTYKFTNSSGTPLASVTISTSTVSVVGDPYRTGVVTLAPNTTYYNQGHSGWNSGLDCKIQAGYLYVVRNSKTSSYFTQKDQSGSDYLYEVSQQNSSTAATRTVTTTLGSSSFAEGTSNLSVSTSGGPGKSVLGRTNKLLYFLYNGSTWSLVQLSAGNLNVSSLTEGSYSLASVLTDGYIYVRADKDDFEVTSASTATLTYHANWYTTGTSGDVPDAQTVAVGAPATVADRNTLAMTNYTFSGWNTEEYITGTSYAVGSSITMDEDKDLYAVWTRSFTLNQNGATKNGTTSVTGTYNCSTLPSITNPQKTGYTFVGWRTENNGTGNLVINTSGELQPKVFHWTDETTPSNRFQRYPSSTSQLYATWTQTVSLNANTGNHGSGTDKTGTATWNGASITIPTHCTPADGYKLEGYYSAATGGTKILNADGTYAGTNVSAGGDTYISSSKWAHAGTTTLWAHYEPKTIVRLYTSNPDNWGRVYAYVWYFDHSSEDGGKNAAWPGEEITLNTVVRSGETFYYYEYYKEDHPNWDRVIFNNNDGKQTNNISFVNTTNNGQYHSAGDRDGAHSSGSWQDLPVDETTYSVTCYAGAHGSITAKGTPIAANSSATVQVGATARPLSASPAGGYYFAGWTKTGSVAIADASSTPTTMTATGTGSVYAHWAEFYLTAPSSSRKTLHYAGNPLTISVHSALPDGCTNIVYSYEYKLSGGSWTAISPASSSVDGGDASCVWNTPSATDNKNYQVRGKVTYNFGGSSHTLYTDASTEITVVGTNKGSKTIKVKKPDEWNTFDGLHLWGSDISEIGWPGYSIQVQHLGGKWYEFVIPDVDQFILNNGIGDGSSNPDKYQTVDLNYSTHITNGYCYVLDNKTEDNNNDYSPQKTFKYNLTYTSNCPAAPSVSTNNISTKNLTSATLGGNITSDGNDVVTEYGYYYSLDSRLASGTVETYGTQVVVGTDDKDGSFSKSQTGLAVGTTYYVIAYAKNAFGTGWGTVKNFTTTLATLSLAGTADYAAKTMTITPTTNMTSGNGFSDTYYVCCTCTSKPAGAGEPTITWNGTTKKLEISGTSVAGNYTFNVKLKPVSNCSGDAFNNADANVTITMKDFVDLSSLTIGHSVYNGTYMNGNGASATPYFIFVSNAASYGKLNLSATLAAALSEGSIYYSVGGSEIGAVSVVSTAASVTMDLPNKTVGAGRSAEIKFYHKLDGQTAPDGKRGRATVYYTVNTDPVVTVSATYNGNPLPAVIPQNADITLSATVTQIPDDNPTFTYSKGDGAYTETTTYTIDGEGTTTLHAKTTYLGDWIGNLNVTTYAAHAVNLVTRKVDMYGDVSESSSRHLFSSTGESYTAPDIEGYTFTGWTCTTEYVRVSDDNETWKGNSTNQTVYVKAPNVGGTLTAQYDEVKRIYYDNRNTKWEHVHIVLFTGSSPWNESKGVIPTTSQSAYAEMTRIGESDIYYYQYGATTIDHVVFTKDDQHGYNEGLYNTQAAYRSDFTTCNPVYVAPKEKNDTRNGVEYFSNGYWRRYMPQKSPFSLYFTDGEDSGNKGRFVPENPNIDAENFKLEVLRGASTTYHFNLPNACGTAYGNNGEMTKDNCTNWTFEPTSKDIGDCRLTTTAGGTYIFHLSTANGQVKLSVEYPLNEGDYQIYYSDGTDNNNNYSDYIRKNTGSSAKNDTVSFFVKKTSSPTYQVKRCTGFTGTTPNWENVGSAQSITVSTDSVYNFVFQQPAGGESISKVGQHFYSGNYYVRTDGAAGGWANYKTNPDNTMKHTDKASALAAGYNFYYLRWIGDADGNSTTNVKYVVATDYNSCVSQEFGNDPDEGSLSGGQKLTGKGANVRFTYNTKTNEMTRTYIGGSAHDANYLVIDGTNLKKSDNTGWSQSTMVDQNDWIYTLELKAASNATIQLQSHYNNKYVTVLPNETILVVNDANYYDLRVIYDYKTNEVVAAYIPSTTVSSPLEVDVDIMFIRKAKDNKDPSALPTTLSLSGTGKITGAAKTLYGAIEFEKDYVRGEGSYTDLATHRPQRSTYWISFPFDVRIKDIFGLGDYTETWIIQRYRGDLRAEKGWFLDTKTFWEYVFDEEYVLKAGQGYVLSIDCEAIQWPNSRTTQYLYFPSKDKITDITSVLPSASMDVPEHTCSITSPADRTIKDAHWNVIGVPGFNDAWGRATETVTVSGGDLRYFYTWDSETNTLSTTSARNYEFKFMHSYMVQYYGNIDWSASEPALAPARRSADAKPEVVEFRIDIMQGDVKKDNTFVTLMDNDKITNGFDMNADLVKMYNANQANIYTIINDVEVSANCLPMTDQTTIVPVGVKIVANGDYTFSIPEGTEGIGVVLVDNETGTRTNLSLTDYEVNLSKGTYDERFVLEISPIKQMPTDIENADASVHDAVRKVVVDGILYIVKEGVVFDARGNRVK